jgi:hypothetical protein
MVYEKVLFGEKKLNDEINSTLWEIKDIMQRVFKMQ